MWISDKHMFRKGDFNRVVEQVRQQVWFPMARANIFNRLWAFNVQLRRRELEPPVRPVPKEAQAHFLVPW